MQLKKVFAFIGLLMAGILLLPAKCDLPEFAQLEHPTPPDYSLAEHWAALPFRVDESDRIPKNETTVHDSLKAADVFFIYPTFLQGKKQWNASLDDTKLNKQIDQKSIRLQASVFNETCRVYAPRYRQSNPKVFFVDSCSDGEKALELAYQDIVAAFQYYMEHYNNGRPIIIAGHSQGTYHARRLLKEFFDDEKSELLVAAYLVGYNVRPERYEYLPLCTSAEQTGCFVSWMSYKKGHEPKWKAAQNTVSVHPISWDTIGTSEANKGTLVLNHNRIKAGKTAVEIVPWKGGTILWLNKTRPPFGLWKNLHIADYNLFWQDIRDNVRLRVTTFLEAEKQ